MKLKSLFVLIFQLIAFGLLAQPWASRLDDRSLDNFYTLENYFNKYNVDNHVQKGKYVLPDGKKIKVPGWKQFKRAEWFWEQRVNPATGEFPKTKAIDRYLQFAQKKSSSLGNWQNIGADYTKGGYAGLGRINCVAFHPTDTSIYWVGTPAGGIWATYDDGNSWEVLSDKNPVLGVSSIAIPTDYATSQTIYIATGDRDGGSIATLGGSANDNNSIGVLKSTNGGKTWQTTGLNFSVKDEVLVYKIMLLPSDNQVIFASTSQGFYKSTDGGDNWTLLSDYSFIDFEFNAGDEQIIYGATINWYYTKVYKSTDGGASWTQVLSKQGRRTELAVSQANSSVVYALVANSNGGLEGIYKSTNSGDSFSQLVDGSVSGNAYLGYYSDGSGDNSGQGSYDLCMAVDPSDINKVYIGGINSWRSSDGGQNWEIMNMWTSYADYNKTGAPTVHADKHYMAFRPNSSVLFETNDGGIYKGFNDGTVWQNKTNGMTISQVYRLSVSQTQTDVVLTGLQDNGSKLLWDGNWYDVTGGDGMECIINPQNVAIQYASYAQGEIYRTDDNWNNQVTISDNISGGSLSGAWVTPYILNPQNPKAIVVAYEELWKSTDEGNNFTKISSFNLNETLKVLDIYKQDSSVIITGTRSKLFITKDNGASWKNITSDLPVTQNPITNVLFSAASADTIWVTMGSYSGNQIYETSNGGASWTNISDGLPDIPAMCIIQNEQNHSTIELYAGMDVGVYVKYGNSSWQVFNNNLPNVVVSDLAIYYDSIDASANQLVAATFGRGVWKSDLYSPNGIENPLDFVVTEKKMGQLELKWQLNGNSDEVVLAYSTTGVFEQLQDGMFYSTGMILNGGATILYTGSDTSYIFNDIQPNTQYYFKIWSKTSASDYSSGIITSIATSCSSLLLPYTQNFDNGGMPDCAEVINELGATSRWTIENSSEAGGNANELVASYEDIANGISRFVFPEFDFSDVSQIMLSFNFTLDDYDTGMFFTLDASDDKIVWKTIDTIAVSGGGNIMKLRDSLLFDAPLGQKKTYLAFSVHGDLYAFDYLYVDNISIEEYQDKQAPAWQKIEKQSIFAGENFSDIDLKQYVSDDNTPVEQLTFSYSGNKNIAVSLSNGIAAFTVNDASWHGTDTISFSATDLDGFSSARKLLLEVKEPNTAPVIYSINNQTIFSGNSFVPVNLSFLVEDDYTARDSIVWKISAHSLNIALNKTILSLSLPAQDWLGTDTIQFVAMDEQGLSDTAYTVFTVLAANNPPVISENLTGETIKQGESFSSIYLDDFVEDVETPDSLIVWSYFNNINLEITITERVLTVKPYSKDWTGKETILLKAKDEAGASDTAYLTFKIDSGTSAVENYRRESDVTIFPNPSDGIITVRLNSASYLGARYDIIQLSGKKIISGKFTELQNQLSLSGLKKGVYILKVFKNNKFTVTKILIE